MQLLINENQMREDIDKSVAVLSSLQRRAKHYTYSITAAWLLLPLGGLAFLGNLWNLPSVGLFSLATAVVLAALYRARNETIASHQKVSKYLDYLLSDARAREFYSRLPESAKTGTGYRPRPGTRLYSPGDDAGTSIEE